MTLLRGVPKARRVAEVAVTPNVRFEIERLRSELANLSAAHHETSQVAHDDRQQISDINLHMPAVLNAIASMSGAARISARQSQAAQELGRRLSDEFAALRELVATSQRELTDVRTRVEDSRTTFGSLPSELAAVRSQVANQSALGSELAKHVETLGWLMTRVETVRAEMLHELRYGRDPKNLPAPAARIVNSSALQNPDLRLNLGAGHVLEAGYVNVDLRELPGIDIVAGIDDLPIGPESVAEIASSHLLEHFPLEQLRRKLLPYWFGLLRPGGTFRAVVPDLDEMSRAYARGDTTFEVFRAVTYGGQEYDGDFHFNAFTPESLGELFIEAGFSDPQVIARARVNGDCLEFEMTATRPDPL